MKIDYCGWCDTSFMPKGHFCFMKYLKAFLFYPIVFIIIIMSLAFILHGLIELIWLIKAWPWLFSGAGTFLLLFGVVFLYFNPNDFCGDKSHDS